jgi:hypothetical protein
MLHSSEFWLQLYWLAAVLNNSIASRYHDTESCERLHQIGILYMVGLRLDSTITCNCQRLRSFGATSRRLIL